MGCAIVAASWLLVMIAGVREPANNCSITLTCDNSNSMLSSVPRDAELIMPGLYEAIMAKGGGYFNSTNDMIRPDNLSRFLEITNDSRQTPCKSGPFRRERAAQAERCRTATDPALALSAKTRCGRSIAS